MGALSQWAREAIVERTRDALRHKRGKGKRVGNIAFGSRLAQAGDLEDPGEQAAFEEIRRLSNQGMTLREPPPLSTIGHYGPGVVRHGDWSRWPPPSSNARMPR